MKLRTQLFFILLLNIALHAQTDTTVAFHNVDIIPMDSTGILDDYTVITSGGLITEIGPSGTITIPLDAYIIEADGKYLMPGLTDMHIHIWDKDYLFLFLANGITTVRNMWGESQHLTWREQIRNGTLLGPELYTTSTILEGDSIQQWPTSQRVSSVSQARSLVAGYKTSGYDFVKIYTTIFKKEIYDAIIDEAFKQDIQVVGHPPFIADSMWTILGHVYETKMRSIEHMEWYLSCIWKIPFIYPPWEWEPYYYNNMDSVYAAKLLKMQIDSGTWTCPTLAVYKNMITAGEYQEALQRPYMKYVKDKDKNDWRPSPQSPWDDDFLKEYRQNADYKKIVKAMYDKGIKLLTGTDCQNPFVVWGFSLHEELQLFVEAGLTPFQALSIATKNAAEFMNAQDLFGTVKQGLRADLILLNSNPLEDIANAQDRVGVMVQGKWLPEYYLQDLLEPKIRHADTFFFDSTNVGTPTGDFFTVFNDGMSTLIIDTIYASANAFKVDYSKKIKAKEKINIFLTFVAEQIGVFNETLTIVSNDTNNTPSLVHLSGVCLTDIGNNNQELPKSHALFQNYPNPFNPNTMISYQLAITSKVELSIYNILGQKVATLVNKKQPAGSYQVEWDASSFASGVYLYELETGNGYRQAKKLVLLK